MNIHWNLFFDTPGGRIAFRNPNITQCGAPLKEVQRITPDRPPSLLLERNPIAVVPSVVSSAPAFYSTH